MRDPEQQRIALDCLRAANDGTAPDTASVIVRARVYYAFVAGEESAKPAPVIEAFQEAMPKVTP